MTQAVNDGAMTPDEQAVELVERLVEAARDTETQLHFGSPATRRLAEIALVQAERAILAALAHPVSGDVEDLVRRLRPALKLLPIECHDTPDYAEATGPQFQAMTMVPEAFLALNALPELLEALARGEGM